MKILKRINKKSQDLREAIVEEVEKNIHLDGYIEILKTKDKNPLTLSGEKPLAIYEKEVLKIQANIIKTCLNICKQINKEEKFLVDIKSAVECAKYFVKLAISDEELKKIISSAIGKEKEKLKEIEESTDYAEIRVKSGAVTKTAISSYKNQEETKETEKLQSNKKSLKIEPCNEKEEGKHYKSTDHRIESYMSENPKVVERLRGLKHEYLVREVCRMYQKNPTPKINKSFERQETGRTVKQKV